MIAIGTGIEIQIGPNFQVSIPYFSISLIVFALSSPSPFVACYLRNENNDRSPKNWIVMTLVEDGTLSGVLREKC